MVPLLAMETILEQSHHPAIDHFAPIFALSEKDKQFTISALVEAQRTGLYITEIFEILDPDATIDADTCDLLERISLQHQACIWGIINLLSADLATSAVE